MTREETSQGLSVKSVLAWGSLVFALLVVFVQRQYLAVMGAYMAQRFQIGLGEVSYLSTATLYGYAVMQLPTGILVDKIGVRRLSISSWGMTLVASVGVMFAPNFAAAWIMRFIIGAGTACSVTSLMKVQATSFSERYFSSLSAAMALLGNLGNFISTVPLSMLFQNVGGFFTLMSITGITFLCFLFILLFVFENQGNIQFRASFQVGKAIRSVWRNKSTYPPLFIIFFFISTATSLGGFWGIAYFKQVYGLDEVQSSWYMACLTVGFLIGSVVVFLTDRWTRGNNKLLLRIFTGLYALSWVYFLVVKKGKPPLEQMSVLLTLMGICIMFHLLAFTVVKNVNAIEYAGVATSSINMMEFIGSAIINMTIAALIGRQIPLEKAMGIMTVFACCAFISSLFIGDSKKEEIEVCTN